jgi:hypothetical protein
MENKETIRNIGIILFLIFLIMKLAHIGDVANWSWWWVTSPLWTPILLALSVLMIIWGYLIIVTIMEQIYQFFTKK